MSFFSWLNQTKNKTTFINSAEVINWNIDKHYLQDLTKNNINIAPTLFIEKGDKISLKQLFEKTNCDFFLKKKTLMIRFILEPAYLHVAGARGFFFARNRISLTCFFVFFAAPPRTLPFRWWRGSCFFYNFVGPVLAAKSPKRECRARARGARVRTVTWFPKI